MSWEAIIKLKFNLKIITNIHLKPANIAYKYPKINMERVLSVEI